MATLYAPTCAKQCTASASSASVLATPVLDGVTGVPRTERILTSLTSFPRTAQRYM